MNIALVPLPTAITGQRESLLLPSKKRGGSREEREKKKNEVEHVTRCILHYYCVVISK